MEGAEVTPPPIRRGRRWTNILREVGIVVAGILIAFSLDAWWDARQTAREDSTQLAALSEEFRSNLTRIESALARHQNIAARSKALQRVLQAHTAGSSAQVPDSLLAAVFEWRTQDWSTGTVQALISSGRLQRIGDNTLRQLLADWPARVEDMNEDQILGRDFIYSVAIPTFAAYAEIAHLVEPWPKTLTGHTSVRVSGSTNAVSAARASQEELVTRSLRVFRAKADSILKKIEGQERGAK